MKPLCLALVAALAPTDGQAAAELGFSLPRLGGGAKVELSAYRGTPVLVDFWATWCEPCKASMAEHQKLARELEGRAVILTINVDEDDVPVRRFVEQRKLTLPVLRDAQGLTAEAFGVTGMPYALVFDREGKVIERIEGEPYPRARLALEKAAKAFEAPPGPVAGAPALLGCAGALDRSVTSMGSRARILVCPTSAKPEATAAAQQAIDEGFQELARLEALWTTWRPDSEISRLNAAAGKSAIAVSAETFEVLRRAREGSERSGGVFDVTFAPLGELWNFDRAPDSHVAVRLERVPAPAEVQARRARVGFGGLTLDALHRTARLEREGMAVHLGGIGKGAAVDRVVALLRAKGLRDFVVQAGGDLFCAGKNGERPWRVGVAHPRKKGQILGFVDLDDAAFSTSGDYERFAIVDGVRYHHIIDLRTGYPATASQSATVLAATATDAEILTKTAFILGGEEGLAALKQAGASGILVDAGGAVLVSEGLLLVRP